jgi:hypothetical protein
MFDCWRWMLLLLFGHVVTGVNCDFLIQKCGRKRLYWFLIWTCVWEKFDFEFNIWKYKTRWFSCKFMTWKHDCRRLNMVLKNCLCSLNRDKLWCAALEIWFSRDSDFCRVCSVSSDQHLPGNQQTAVPTCWVGQAHPTFHISSPDWPGAPSTSR